MMAKLDNILYTGTCQKCEEYYQTTDITEVYCIVCTYESIKHIFPQTACKWANRYIKAVNIYARRGVSTEEFSEGQVYRLINLGSIEAIKYLSKLKPNDT